MCTENSILSHAKLSFETEKKCIKLIERIMFNFNQSLLIILLLFFVLFIRAIYYDKTCNMLLLLFTISAICYKRTMTFTMLKFCLLLPQCILHIVYNLFNFDLNSLLIKSELKFHCDTNINHLYVFELN